MPFGETWVEESSKGFHTNYLFTSKELDTETGLYYYGARYYDPRTSVWLSTDPIFAIYLPRANQFEKAVNKFKVVVGFPELDLPGNGGVYRTSNLSLYTYSGNNPLRYNDPDGNENEDKVEKYPDHTKRGGSHSWRTNNPGNLEYGEFAKSQGAIGTDSEGRFAKFPNAKTGEMALRKLLSGGKYKNLKVFKAMKRYAPKPENKPKEYAEFLIKNGVDPEKPVGQQIDAMVAGIKKFEKWNAGTIEPKVTKPSNPGKPDSSMKGISELIRSCLSGGC